MVLVKIGVIHRSRSDACLHSQEWRVRLDKSVEEKKLVRAGV